MKYYDETNIFNKIIKGEIPCEKIYEDDEVLCFKDINPIAKIHVLFIPKEKYVSFDDFVQKSEPNKITSYFKKLQLIAKKLNLQNSGYRIIANHGSDAGQEVPHFHFHLLGGEKIGGLK
tara:strand:- start:247 stop:603 length:357 start_codon:yes stop_codon:yes gene_type:complete